MSRQFQVSILRHRYVILLLSPYYVSLSGFYFPSGGYEPVAKTIFQDIKVDILYLEWESDRAGNFEPLRFLIPGRKVVLGLISSKIGTLEKKDQIIRRIKEAASFCGEGLDQLALSTQCGFSVMRNILSIILLMLMVFFVVNLSRECYY